MAAFVEFSFSNIRPGSTVSVYIHGYSDREAVNYSAVVFPQLLEGVAGGPVVITQGSTSRHIDGSVARVVSIQNPSSGWQDVQILCMSEAF